MIQSVRKYYEELCREFPFRVVYKVEGTDRHPLRKEIAEWMVENIRHGVSIEEPTTTWNFGKPGWRCGIRFENETEALLFKMRWVG